jgi:hypothetical protein
VAGVFQHDADGTESQIGTYERNYTFLRTFWWFRRGARHFALYSRHYTATRILEIVPGGGIADLGGEEPDGGGFCPVEFFVPDCREGVSEEYCGPGERIENWMDAAVSLPAGCQFQKELLTHKGRARVRGDGGRYVERERRCTVDGVEQAIRLPAWGDEQDYEGGWIKFPPDHGFVAGCGWGDDSSWKIQYLDLSRVEEGLIRREERFGCVELPRSVLLRDAVDVDYEEARVEIAIKTVWDLHKGRLESPEILGVSGRETKESG